MDENLKQFANPLQATYIDAITAARGNIRKAARRLGKHHSTLQNAVRLVEAAAAAHGYAPKHGLDHPIPAPFVARGHSTLDKIHNGPIDPVTGRQQVLQWTKTRIDDTEWLKAVQEGVEAFVAEQPPLPVGSPPLVTDNDIIPWIQIGDAHLGMLAHEAETGANFDLKIATAELKMAISMLIDELPDVDRLVINDLGDFTHYENMRGETDASGHKLDFDGRFPKMIEVYSELMRFIVDKALTKARNVDVIVNMGNHSRTNDIWMAVLLRAVYGNSGRVNVLNNGTPFIGYRMGNTLVMTHHSDLCKPAKLAHVMATDFAADWGECDYRYIDIGHIHHGMVLKEHPGVLIESWNQLAAKDKWAHDGGYRSRQSIAVAYRSRTYGDMGRRVLPLRQVQDRIRATAHGKDHYIAPVRRAYAV